MADFILLYFYTGVSATFAAPLVTIAISDFPPYAGALWHATTDHFTRICIAIFYCSKTSYDEQTVFFYRKNNPLIDWQGLHDFEKCLIGVTQGYSYTDDFWFLAKTGALQVDIAQSEQQNMARLLKREIDVFPMSLMAGQYLLKTQFDQSEQQKITYHSQALTEKTHHLLFLKRHKNSRRLRVDFNKGLSELRKSGEYQQIVDQYLQL